jgi:hypothetical protein
MQVNILFQKLTVNESDIKPFKGGTGIDDGIKTSRNLNIFGKFKTLFHYS